MTKKFVNVCDRKQLCFALSENTFAKSFNAFEHVHGHSHTIMSTHAKTSLIKSPTQDPTSSYISRLS